MRTDKIVMCERRPTLRDVDGKILVRARSLTLRFRVATRNGSRRTSNDPSDLNVKTFLRGLMMKRNTRVSELSAKMC